MLLSQVITPAAALTDGLNLTHPHSCSPVISSVEIRTRRNDLNYTIPSLYYSSTITLSHPCMRWAYVGPHQRQHAISAVSTLCIGRPCISLRNQHFEIEDGPGTHPIEDGVDTGYQLTSKTPPPFVNSTPVDTPGEHEPPLTFQVDWHK